MVRFGPVSVGVFATLLATACDAFPQETASEPSSVAIQQATSASRPAVPVNTSKAQYPTSIGMISIAVPDNYVRLSKVDAVYFDVFAAQLAKLDVIEVFISSADHNKSKMEGAPLRDQMFQIQLFPPHPDDVPIDDVAWKKLSKIIPAFMSGKQAADVIVKAESPAVERFNTLSKGRPTMTDVDMGKVVIYRVSERDVRWMVKGDVALQEGGKPSAYRALVVSALIRKGTNIFMLQSATQVQTPQDDLEAQQHFDAWASSVN